MNANYRKVVNDVRIVVAVAEMLRGKVGQARNWWRYQHRANRLLARLRGETGDWPEVIE